MTFLHPKFYYLFISPFETNPHIGACWNIQQFSSIGEVQDYIATRDITKDWVCFTGQEILDILFKKAEEEEMN